MADSLFRKPTLRLEWIRDRHRPLHPPTAPLRAGVAGACLPRLRLDVPHLLQERIADSVPCCAAMVLGCHGRYVEPGWLAEVLRTDDLSGTPGERLEWLHAWGVEVEMPRRLQFFRDGTLDLDRRLGSPEARLVYRWEECWLRWVRNALEEGDPPILFVDLGRLYPTWRGFRQSHAVVLSGGDGRQAWIHDPSRRDAPVRVGLSRLMDSLLPYEPLAAVLRPGDLAFTGDGEPA